MSMTGTFQPDPADDLEWSVNNGGFVIHYSSRESEPGRPLTDWMALFASGFVLTVLGFTLLLAMATHPLT